MAWTNVGFDGTINEAQWSQMSTLMGSSGGGYLAAGNGDCLVTAVPGARSVSVAAGSLYGDGVVSTNSAPEVVAMTTPVNGQWYVIALRRTWATNTAALVAIAGATTTTTTPTAPPTSFPTLNTNQGVLTDQPIAWAWCNSANTTVVVYDIRLKGIKSTPPVVANANERDAKFMTPSQGLQVWRDDIGAVETYFGLYNSSTNPGGRDTAGWYIDGRSGGLIPMRPTSVVIGTGTGSASALGVVSFSGATSITLNNVFTSAYRNYRIVINIDNASTQMSLGQQLTSGGTAATGGNYYWAGWWGSVTGNGPGLLAAQTQTNWYMIEATNTVSWFNHVQDIFNPAIAKETSMTGAGGTYSNAWRGVGYNCFHQVATAYDGMKFTPTAGTVNGTIQVFGYND